MLAVPTDEERKAALQQIVTEKFPGRAWEDLSQAEQQSVFADYKSRRSAALDMINTPMPKGQNVGPSGIYVNNPWDSVGAGVRRAIGGYQLGKANREEQMGRGALADLQTRRDFLDSEEERRRREEEQRQRNLLMQGIFGQ